MKGGSNSWRDKRCCRSIEHQHTLPGEGTKVTRMGMSRSSPLLEDRAFVRAIFELSLAGSFFCAMSRDLHKASFFLFFCVISF